MKYIPLFIFGLCLLFGSTHTASAQTFNNSNVTNTYENGQFDPTSNQTRDIRIEQQLRLRRQSQYRSCKQSQNSSTTQDFRCDDLLDGLYNDRTLDGQLERYGSAREQNGTITRTNYGVRRYTSNDNQYYNNARGTTRTSNLTRNSYRGSNYYTDTQRFRTDPTQGNLARFRRGIQNYARPRNQFIRTAGGTYDPYYDGFYADVDSLPQIPGSRWCQNARVGSSTYQNCLSRQGRILPGAPQATTNCTYAGDDSRRFPRCRRNAATYDPTNPTYNRFARQIYGTSSTGYYSNRSSDIRNRYFY